MKARDKILIGAAAGVVAVGAAGGAAYFVFFDKELRYQTQAELRAATPQLATAELRARGHTLSAPLACRDMPGWTKQKMRVRCDGRTTRRERVQVLGAAEDKVKEEYFTILLNGRPVVQNAGCLATDCPKKDG